MQKIFSKLLIVLGVVCVLVAAYLFYLRYSSHPLTFEKAPKIEFSDKNNTPKTLEIPSINVNLPIFSSVIKGTAWQTTTIGVSYLSTTPIPGTKGNSVIYGHNWTSLLGSLPKVKPGQNIFITMQNGEKKSFKIVYTAVVSPNQTYIIDNTKDTRVTIYTCTGFLDSRRFVVVAKPLNS
jgi:LPXTG-site transpeptidase (sortase) family protein